MHAADLRFGAFEAAALAPAADVEACGWCENGQRKTLQVLQSGQSPNNLLAGNMSAAGEPAYHRLQGQLCPEAFLILDEHTSESHCARCTLCLC